MPARIDVVYMRAAVQEGEVVNTCSGAKTGWERDLSPFLLGPCALYDGLFAQNVENAWQFSKVYKCHLNQDGLPNDEWVQWSRAGFGDKRAHRYPMGRGAVPEYSFWVGVKLGYVQARKEIYGPLYANAVLKTEGWKRLKELYETNRLLVLRDWDGRATAETLTEVLNNPRRKMGHAFVLKMLLTKDPALNQLEMGEH